VVQVLTWSSRESMVNFLQPQTERGSSTSAGTVVPTHEVKKVCQCKPLVRKFIFIRTKQGEGQGKEKCHVKSMMSNEVNEKLGYTLSMCHLVRTRRKKYEGRD
jgi:hypothetical protein